jgi:four helix bundle protein
MEYKKIQQFTDLIVWQKAHCLVLMIYQITKSFPREELYCLVDQLRRAVISITSNIAEGFTRRSYKEKAQFYYQALGSLTEIQNQLIASRDLNYINQKLFDTAFSLTVDVYRLLNAFILKTKSFSKKSKF